MTHITSHTALSS